MGMFASQSPGFHDDLLLIDSTPVECARSRETVKRSALGDAADYGWCASHSRYFWGFRLHAIFARTAPHAPWSSARPKLDERDVGLVLLDRCRRHGGETLLGDKGYAGREFAAQVAQRDATIRPPAPQRRSRAAARTSPRSANESNRSSGPAKTSSPSNATAPAPSQACANAILARFCCLAAAITLNHQLGRPSRALVNYCA